MRNYNISVKTAFAVLAVALSACSSDNDITENNPVNPETPVSNNEQMTFSVSMDAGNETRTVFNGNNTIWEAGDQIRVMNRATITASGQSNYSWYGNFDIVKQSGTFTKEEVFTGTRIQSNGDGTDCFYAFYPSSSKLGYDDANDNGAMNGVLDAQQTAIAGSFDKSLHLMTAFSNNTTFAFKNVCALLRITLSNSNIRRIKVVANPSLSNPYAQKFTYTYISGAFNALVNKNDGTTTDGNGESTVMENKNNTNRLTYVELHAGDKTATTKIEDGTYYMVVLPATLNKGFTLLFEKYDGTTIYQRVNNKTQKFERNQVYDLGTYNCSSLPSDMVALTDVVDLDLPSGTLWCTKNMNNVEQSSGWVMTGFVTNESDYGASVSFGYEYTKGSMGDVPSDRMTNRTLKGAYDAAYNYAPFNKKYCMPVYAQMYEFYNHFPNAYKASYANSTPSGARFTAPTGTGRTIWLPYAGSYWGGNNGGKGTEGRYWSRTHTNETGTYADAYDLDLEEGTVNSKKVPILDDHGGLLEGGSEWRDDSYVGRSIRPVVTNTQIAPIYE